MKDINDFRIPKEENYNSAVAGHLKRSRMVIVEDNKMISQRLQDKRSYILCQLNL